MEYSEQRLLKRVAGAAQQFFFLGSNFSEETMATMWFYKYTAELEGGGGLRVIC